MTIELATQPGVRERFMAKVVAIPGGCWEWSAFRGIDGYARFSIGGRNGSWALAHRVSWWIHRGEIPDGLVLDHLCRVRHCVNPDHLEPVTSQENSRRGIAGEVNAARLRSVTHCPQGHAYDELNTGFRRDGRRTCRACTRERTRRRRASR